MDQERAAHIFFEYDLTPLSVDPMNFRNSWRVMTGEGGFLLKKLDVERIKVIETSNWLDKLQQKGLNCVIPYVKTKYGESHIHSHEGNYVLLPLVEKLMDIHELKNWEIRVIKKMATLHHMSQVEKKIPLGEEGILTHIEERWKMRVNEFKQFRLKNHTRLNSLIEEGKKKALRLANLAIFRLNEIKEHMNREGKVRLVLCHGHIHRKNIIVGKNRKIYFVKFEKAILDTPVKDLALFFRRYAPYHNWDPGIGAEWLNAYTEIHSLTHVEILLLGCYLLYPERVIRDVIQHGKTSLFQQKGYHQWYKRIDELGVMERFVRIVTTPSDH